MSIAEGSLSCAEKQAIPSGLRVGVDLVWGRAKGRLGLEEGNGAKLRLHSLDLRQPPESLERDF